MQIGDKTETGFIFDIRDNVVYECQHTNFGVLLEWKTAMLTAPEGWRLPTQDELANMYNNLAKRGIGNFDKNSYWSSTENDPKFARMQNFSNGNQFDHHEKTNILFVRLVKDYTVDITPEEKIEHEKFKASIIEDTGEIFVGDVLSENFYKVVKNKKSILKTAIKEVEDIYYKWFNKKHIAPNAEQLHIMQKMFNLIQELKNQIEELQK